MTDRPTAFIVWQVFWDADSGLVEKKLRRSSRFQGRCRRFLTLIWIDTPQKINMDTKTCLYLKGATFYKPSVWHVNLQGCSFVLHILSAQHL